MKQLDCSSLSASPHLGVSMGNESLNSSIEDLKASTFCDKCQQGVFNTPPPFPLDGMLVHNIVIPTI